MVEVVVVVSCIWRCASKVILFRRSGEMCVLWRQCDQKHLDTGCAILWRRSTHDLTRDQDWELDGRELHWLTQFCCGSHAVFSVPDIKIIVSKIIATVYQLYLVSETRMITSVKPQIIMVLFQLLCHRWSIFTWQWGREYISNSEHWKTCLGQCF